MRANNLFLINSLLITMGAGLATSVLAYQDADQETETTTEPTTVSTLTDTTITTNSTTPGPAPTPTTTIPPATTTKTPPTTKRPNPPDCPSPCWCTQKVVDCEGRQLTELPRFDQKSQYVEFKFANNSIKSVDFKALPVATVQSIDLSHNQIVSFEDTSRRRNELPMLRSLNLTDNSIVTLLALSAWRMPLLEELNLERNEIVALTRSDFTKQPKLVKLHLQQQFNVTTRQSSDDFSLKSIDEGTFAPLSLLQHLNLSQSLQFGYHLPNQLFAKNPDLETLDLSYNRLVEVPVAVRSANNLKKLILSGNMMTSLRPSDFFNMKKIEHLQMSYCPRFMRVDPFTFGEQAKLKKLILSNNPSFFDFSSEAFLNNSQIVDDLRPLQPRTKNVLALLDLSGNNMTTMSDPLDSPQSLFRSSIKQIDELRLGNNPWDCSCALEWLTKSTNLSGQQPIHCKTPSKYADLEISQYFQLVDCQIDDSSLQRFVMVLFLMFLIVLTLLVFIQKTDICRRLQWRDQYGTIYYTKASFPTEQV